MSTHIYFDSDDERDSFDVERRQIELFQRHCLQASIESSEDDDEGIIDGTKVPSSSKARSRARHTYFDISTLSSSPSSFCIDPNDGDNDDDLETNPFTIISKSIDIEHNQPKNKKKKSLGVPKTRVVLDITDIYDQDDSNPSREEAEQNSEPSDKEDLDPQAPKKNKADKKPRIRKPTKAAVLETERKMQQLSRSEHLVLPTFIPKPLGTWQALEKRSRQELMNEIRAKNPSFTPQDPELPDLPVMEPEPTAASTLADLAKMVEEKPPSKLDRLSRFLNPALLTKKPTISSNTKQSDIMIDLSDTKKPSNPPTVKTNINLPLDSVQSPSSSKKLLDMQKQLGIRMRAKRAAMLAENTINIPMKDDDEIMEEENDVEDDSMDTTDESNDATSDAVSTMEKDNENLQIDEETQHFVSDGEETEEEEEEDEQDDDEVKENTNPPSDPNRPSLKTVLARMESSSESVQPTPPPNDANGQAEWFASSRPAEFDTNIELLCSGAFGGDNIIPLSQNYTHVEPMAFSPLPTTQLDDDEDIVDGKKSRSKVRQLIDDDDDDDISDGQRPEPIGSGSTLQESEEEEEQGDNEELVDYKKQLFEMEAEESGSEAEDKEPDDENDSDDDDEADEELAKFIDTAAIEIDENDVDDMAKMHLKIKAKEDEHQLKMLKEQYLDFDGDDDGRRLKISKANDDDDEEDDPNYNSDENNNDDDDDDEDEDDPMNMKDRITDLERQRSMQDNQAEELHLDEDLDNIGQHSSMFQKGLALKQKKIQSTTASHTDSPNGSATVITTKKPHPARSVTLSSVLLAQRFSSTLLAPVNKSNLALPHGTTTSETSVASKKQHNPRRHIFATSASTNENQNPVASSGEKRSNSTEKSPTKKIKRFKQATTTTSIPVAKPKEVATSVFSALALSTTRR